MMNGVYTNEADMENFATKPSAPPTFVASYYRNDPAPKPDPKCPTEQIKRHYIKYFPDAADWGCPFAVAQEGDLIRISFRDGASFILPAYIFHDAIDFAKYANISNIEIVFWRADLFYHMRTSTPWDLWQGVYERFEPEGVNISLDGLRWVLFSFEEYKEVNEQTRIQYEAVRRAGFREMIQRYDAVVRAKMDTKYVPEGKPLTLEQVNRLRKLGLNPYQKYGKDRLYLNSNKLDRDHCKPYIDCETGNIMVDGGTPMVRAESRQTLEEYLRASESDEETANLYVRLNPPYIDPYASCRTFY